VILCHSKSDNTIRIFSQNVNGFSIPKNDFTGGSFSTFYQQLLPSDFDIICCQELNLDTNQPILRRLLSSITSRHFSKGIFTCSQTPGSHTHSFYKPGGTSITLTSSISSRLHETRNDPWGRWTGVILNGRSPIKIAIYSIYQVINTSWAAVAGTQTISAQHYMLIHNLYDSTQQSLSPKKKFQTDFQTELKFVQQHITPHILVIGDFNESNSSDFISHISAIFSLNNLLLEHHPNCKLPSTYTRGRRCLDHALGTSIFQQSLQKCGYHPFFLLFHSDHRSFFLDFDSDSLFHMPAPKSAPNFPRKLQTNNKRQVLKYISLKFDYLQKHHAFQLADKLHTQGNHTKLSERLDKTLVQASLYAENKLQRLPKFFWSVEIQNCRRKVTLYQLYKSQFRLHLNSLPLITTIRNSIPGDIPIPTSLSQTDALLRQAQQQLRQAIHDHKQLRHKELKERIDQLLSVGDKSSRQLANILRNITRAEELKSLFNKLRGVLKSQEFSGITKVQIPTDPTADCSTCTSWTTLDIPTEIHQALLTRNHQHFQQAHGTPFTVSPLSHDLSYNGVDGSQTSSILAGTYDSTTLDGATQTILKQISHINSLNLKHPQLTPQISKAQYVSKLKVWKESTTTSPSGVHLGHYKANITPLH